MYVEKKMWKEKEKRRCQNADEDGIVNGSHTLANVTIYCDVFTENECSRKKK